jgi:ligand-binding SRPBCC domain-containing protein
MADENAIGGGGGGSPDDATYITQTANATLTNEQVMGDLATGIVKNTTTTGVQSIAVPGTDYVAPAELDRRVSLVQENVACSADITYTQDSDDSQYFKMTFTSDCTLAFTFQTTEVVAITLQMINGGANTITWPVGIVWIGGAEPTLQAAGTDFVVLWQNGDDVVHGNLISSVSGGGGGGAWTPITSTTIASDAFISFADLDATKNHIFVFSNLSVATNSVEVHAEVSTDNGATWKTGASDYSWVFSNFGSGGGYDVNDSQIKLNNTTYPFSNSAGASWTSLIMLTGAGDNSEFTNLTHKGGYMHTSLYFTNQNGAGTYKFTTVVDAIKFLASSGNLAAGIITHYTLDIS